jgi:hypothetical protein
MAFPAWFYRHRFGETLENLKWPWNGLSSIVLKAPPKP